MILKYLCLYFKNISARLKPVKISKQAFYVYVLRSELIWNAMRWQKAAAKSERNRIRVGRADWQEQKERGECGGLGGQIDNRVERTQK